MSTTALEASQRTAAKTAAVAYLLSFATVVAVNFGIFGRLLTRGDPARAAANILAQETLFRVGIAGQLLYCIGVIVVSASFYVVLKTIDPHLALLAILGRLVHGFTWVLLGLHLLTALTMLREPEYAALSPAELPVLVRPYLSASDPYYVGLLFWSLGSTIGAYVWLKSRYVPKALAGFGIIASAWAVACTVAFFLFPDFPKIVNLWWFDIPLVLFEIALSVLLLVRGLRLAT